jgi:hypothetical protein
MSKERGQAALPYLRDVLGSSDPVNESFTGLQKSPHNPLDLISTK